MKLISDMMVKRNRRIMAGKWVQEANSPSKSRNIKGFWKDCSKKQNSHIHLLFMNMFWGALVTLMGRNLGMNLWKVHKKWIKHIRGIDLN